MTDLDACQVAMDTMIRVIQRIDQADAAGQVLRRNQPAVQLRSLSLQIAAQRADFQAVKRLAEEIEALVFGEA